MDIKFKLSQTHIFATGSRERRHTTETSESHPEQDIRKELENVNMKIDVLNDNLNIISDYISQILQKLEVNTTSNKNIEHSTCLIM